MAKANNFGLDYNEKSLSPAGKALLKNKERILQKWASAVRSEIDRARSLREPVLIDTLPVFLDNLAVALSKGSSRATAVRGTTIADEHGGERARMSQYEPQHLIQEYQILRRVIFAELKDSCEMTHEVSEVIYNSMDEAVREAVIAFALAQFQVRDQFIATLSHDLRNPLGAAKMAIEIIASEPGLGGEVAQLAEKAVANIRRVDRMVQDLLDVTYSRNSERLQLQISEFELSEAVEEVVRDMRLRFKNRFTLIKKPVTGYFDRDALGRALENLIVNAVKYGEPETEIDIVLSCQDERVMLSVHNMGNVIPPEELESIFLAFRRSRSEQGQTRGWGLGLALVKAVVECHGGSVIVDSDRKRGTTFTMSFPADARGFQNG